MSKASELTAVIKRRLAAEEAALLLDDLPGHEAREFETHDSYREDGGEA